MGIDELREYCLAKPGTTEGLPFGPTTLVLKVMDKMFALVSLDEVEGRVNLKCDPERSAELREQYAGIVPGWHMSKVHWNTVYLESDVEPELVRELIDHSYSTVVSKLPKKVRAELETSK